MDREVPEFCPACGSDNVSPPRLSPVPLLLSWLLFLPLIIPVRSRKRHCFDCGKDFWIGKSGK